MFAIFYYNLLFVSIAEHYVVQCAPPPEPKFMGVCSVFTTLDWLPVTYNLCVRAAICWLFWQVLVHDLTSGRDYQFPCGRWLARNKKDGKTMVDLYPISGKLAVTDRSKTLLLSTTSCVSVS